MINKRFYCFFAILQQQSLSNFDIFLMRVFHFLIFVFSFLIALGCNKEIGAPSGKAKVHRMEDTPDGFGHKPKKNKNSRAPQMGFYYKKPKVNPVHVAALKVKYIFAGKKKQHKLGNDQTAASQAYNNGKQSESLSRMNQSFTKGRMKRKGAKRTRNRQGDNTADSFAKNPNKKERKGLFKRNK